MRLRRLRDRGGRGGTHEARPAADGAGGRTGSPAHGGYLRSGGATATQRRREAADRGGTDHADRWKHEDARAAPDGDEGAMQEQRRGGFSAARLFHCQAMRGDRSYLSQAGAQVITPGSVTSGNSDAVHFYLRRPEG